MNEKLVSIVKDLYAALPKMDWATYQAHLHPEFRVVESNDLPIAGTYEGMAGFLQLIEKAFGLFSEFEPTPGAICAGDDHVMVWVEIKLTGRQSNKTITTQLIEVFKFKDEKLIEIRPFYFDGALVHSIL